MKIYDISLPMTKDIPAWPGDPPFVLERILSMDEGERVNVSRLECSAHFGTHVDAPHHFLNDGRTIETLSLEVLTGPASVIQLFNSVRLITSSILESTTIPHGTTRLLIKTHNSSLWKRGEKSFQTNFTAIAPDGAEWLIDQGVRLVGVDYLSVAPYKAGIQTHKALLQGGVIILEGLNLSEVDPGIFELFCLPLNLVGSDGAPARAILIG